MRTTIQGATATTIIGGTRFCCIFSSVGARNTHNDFIRCNPTEFPNFAIQLSQSVSTLRQILPSSPQMVRKAYARAVRKADAERWWALE